MFDSQEMNQQTIPYQEPREPAPPPVPPRRRGGGLRTGAIIGLILVLVVVFGVGLFAGWEFGRNGSTLAPGAGQLPPLSGTTLDKVREAVVVKVTPAVVQVNVLTQNGGAIGSGVIIDSRGYIITNNHVVNGAQTIQVVLNDGTKLPAQLSGTDPPDDLAVLKIQPPGNMTVATIGDSSQLRVGQEVLAIGNPLGITQTVTNGIVSALGRTVSEGQGGATISNAIQTDAPINPGNSGGALVDLQGNLVGIPTLTAIDPEFNTPANGVGFAIPSNRVKSIISQIIQTG
ncbi:MAG: trypsin-like serine protease [Chloroflexi bacterium]|nr:MAG: trypsin-like serine protease [Chloroflexota bacterium]